MLGLADYLSDDDESAPKLAPEIKDKGTQSKKRVINVLNPISFARDEDDDAEARPVKKVNAGSSLANLLPAPKNAAIVSDKKQTKPSTSIHTTTSSSTISKTTKTGSTKPSVTRTANPLLHLHRASSNSSTRVDTSEDTPSDEPFFPTMDVSTSYSQAKTTNEPHHNTTPQKAHTYHPTSEASASQYPQASAYPQQQYNEPYNPPAQQDYTQEQQHYQQQEQNHQQPQTQYTYYDPTTPQGITAPYKGRSKREPDFNELGANIIEVNQKDMLQKNRPGYSESSRLAEIRRAKVSIPAPKPSKLQRSRHQLTAMEDTKRNKKN